MSNYAVALERAIDRDIRDEERLEHLASLVTEWLDLLVPELKSGRLEHPDARWEPDDLAVDLQAHLNNIRHEQEKLKGPPVLDDDDY